MMNSRKLKQDVEYLIEWEALADGSSGPELQLAEAVPGRQESGASRKAPAAAPRPEWEATSELILDLGSNKPRSRLH
jgi:hypothetical protein